MNLLKKLTKKNDYPAANYDTTFVFTSGGIDYYEFTDFNNTPALRGLKTMVFYEEFRMKCTLDFLKLHTEAIDNILSKKTIDIFAIKKLNDQLKQRLDLALDTELLYKIGSVVYFDKKENIEDYDFGYNAAKIEHWKKNEGADFFLQRPWIKLLPVLEDFPGSLQAYSRMVERLNQFHLESLLPNLPEQRTKNLSGKSYLSQVATPRK